MGPYHHKIFQNSKFLIQYAYFWCWVNLTKKKYKAQGQIRQKGNLAKTELGEFILTNSVFAKFY